MQAVLVDAFRDDSKIHAGEAARPIPKAGEVLIQVESSVIGHFDFVILAGAYGGYGLPFVPGAEGAGTVVECGEGTEALLGVRVQTMGVGLWAQYAVAKAEQVVPLLDEISFDQGAAMWGNPVAVLMFREYVKKGGHRAVVQNAANSALGKMFIRLCQVEGIPLINIVRSAASAETVLSEGGENVLNSSDANFLTDYKAVCTRLNATIAFDAVAGDMTGTVLSGLCAGGVVYVFGVLSHQPSNSLQASDIIFQGKRVEGLGTVVWLGKKANEEKQQLYREIQLSLSTLFRTEFVGHFPLAQVQEALASYKANLSAGKVLLHPNRH